MPEQATGGGSSTSTTALFSHRPRRDKLEPGWARLPQDSVDFSPQVLATKMYILDADGPLSSPTFLSAVGHYVKEIDLKLFKEKPSQDDIVSFQAIAYEIQRGNVQDAQLLERFQRLGWVTKIPAINRWVLTGAGLEVHARATK